MYIQVIAHYVSVVLERHSVKESVDSASTLRPMDNNNTEIMNTETSHTLCYSSTLTTPPGGVVVRVLARNIKGRGFNSRPFHFQVTTLGKLLTHTCLCHLAV